MKRKWVFKAAKIVVLGLALVVTAGAVVMWLWNALIPEIFGASQITWFQALGLLVLARLLVGGRGSGSGGGGRRRWRERWERKLASMTPEERERCRTAMGRCGEADLDDTATGAAAV